MAKKKKKSSVKGGKGGKKTATGPLVTFGAGVVKRGWPVVVRRIGSVVDPKLSVLAPFHCQQSITEQIFLDPEEDSIRALREAIENAPLEVNGGTVESAHDAVKKSLDTFNAAHGTAFALEDPCTMPNHISTGGGGCRPGLGHTFVLTSSTNPDPAFGMSKTNKQMVAHGYAISVNIDP